MDVGTETHFEEPRESRLLASAAWRGIRTTPARRPWPVLALVLLVTLGALDAARDVQAEVDFTATVPPSPHLDAYRDMLEGLEGVRFSVVYLEHEPRSGTGSLRTDAGFDALVDEQARLTARIEDALPPGAVSHTLSAYEAMRAGNYMLAKLATGGNPPESAYAVPSDPATYRAVRDQVRDGGNVDDVLAADGSSALLLVFFETRDLVEARALAGQLEGIVAQWGARTSAHPATTGHATSGLLNAAHYVDEVNGDETRRWGLAAGGAVLVALALLLRGPVNALIAVGSLGVALAWTYGAMGLLGVRISFLTLFLAPIVVGVGVDYAVHVLQRHEEERATMGRRDAVGRALERTGAPVLVASATTIVGLSALLLVPAPLFAEIGGVAALGIGLGVVASLVVAPALRAAIPQGRPTARRDLAGRSLVAIGRAVARNRGAAVLVLVVLVGGAAAYAWTNARFAANSVDDELPEDDPVAALQRKIEADYGAFERAYLVVRGDATDPRVLLAIHEATRAAGSLEGVRAASSVTDLLLADARTDAGAIDLATGALLGPAGRAEEADLPQTRAEARERLDRLFSDPLWRSLAPFTVSEDYRLAVVALTIDPWNDSAELETIATRLERAAADLDADLPREADAQAAGPPVNRANVLAAVPRNVAIATLGSVGAVFLVLLVAWRRRGRAGMRVALGAATIVLGACILLLASVPLLDAAYRGLHEAGLTPANRAQLSDILLLAFAVTVASGVDDVVVLAHRHWEARDAGASPEEARDEAFRHAGRAVTATTIVNALAFAILGGTYFLQSKNLAILTAAGIVFAYLLTLVVAPLVLPRE